MNKRYDWAKKYIEQKVNLSKFYQFFAVHDKILPDYRLLYADLTIPVCRRTSRSSGRAPELGIILVNLGRRDPLHSLFVDLKFVLHFFHIGLILRSTHPIIVSQYTQEEL